MKRKEFKSSAWKTVLAIVLVIAALVACTSILGHTLNGVRSSYSPSKFTSLVTYDFAHQASFGERKVGQTQYSNGVDVNLNMKSFKVDMGNGNFGYTIDEPGIYVSHSSGFDLTSTDCSADIFIGGITNLNEDYLCIVFDLDIDLESSTADTSVGIRPDYRDASGSLAYAQNTAFRLYGDGRFMNNKSLVVAENLPSDCHFTYILWKDGRADIYINGDYIYSLDKATTDQTTHFNGLRIGLTHKPLADYYMESTFTNIKMKTFYEGYIGSILSLYDFPDQQLQTKPDTVLGGGY